MTACRDAGGRSVGRCWASSAACGCGRTREGAGPTAVRAREWSWAAVLARLLWPFYLFPLFYFHFYLYAIPWTSMHVYMCCQTCTHPCGVH